MSLLVLDTHAWLWWESDPERLSNTAAALIDAADRLGVCTVSCWELAMLTSRGRIALDRPVKAWVGQALGRERVEPLTLSVEAAIESAVLPSDRFPGDPADRFIYASTRLAGGRLLTRDQRLRGYDPALAVW
ncbi:MAG TPA: type II toxin-antitoxin system VapC family toxin [Chloroflexota bacterium]|jgi:PIN domain nuclease of toxin-antitoxin system|nr:type II toxin-antitoxin system VapC family toxin [Chloroflexota bacterium]